MKRKGNRRNEPTLAPGMDTHRSLEEEPTPAERSRGDVTEVTRLYLDRTPED
ncbi:hypothetical protein [Cohnella caldifontis]|uniref:hypothetical protein n=1 Tax=Cohnella caldifontis TaxID=3027471 RepID=UPI0023EB0B0A|nr:hypothetical protein [Cohnella sp. YIM B05605]